MINKIDDNTIGTTKEVRQSIDSIVSAIKMKRGQIESLQKQIKDLIAVLNEASEKGVSQATAELSTANSLSNDEPVV